MAKKLRKRPPEPTPPPAEPGLSRYRHAVAALLGFAWLAYLLFFAATELPSVPVRNNDGSDWLRLQLWLAALDPATILHGWTGGSWANVGFASRWWVAAWTAVYLVIAYAPGRLLIDVLFGLGSSGAKSTAEPPATLSNLERHVLSLAIGLHMQSLFILALGLAGLISSGWMLLIPSVVAWLGLGVQWVRTRSRDVADRQDPSTTTANVRPTAVALIATIPFLAIILLGAMLPPHDFDVREYHLQAPKEWYQQGSIGFVPHNVYANMPLGAEMHALGAMCLVGGDEAWWWGALIGKTIMACFVPLTVAGLYCAGKRWMSPLAGAIAALAYASTPWIARTAMKGLNEPAVAFYTLLAVFAVGMAFRNQGSRWRYFALAGCMAGAAVSCKYPALLFLVVPLAVWPIAWWMTNRIGKGWVTTQPTDDVGWGETQPVAPGSSFMFSGVLIIAALLSSGLWFAKNAVLAGNPTYPLLYEVFGGQTRTAEKNEQWNAAHGGEAELTIGSLSDAFTRVAWSSEWYNPLIVPLGIVGVAVGWLSGQRRRLTLLLFVIAFTLAGWYLATHRIDRFLVPLLPLASLLVGFGVCGCWTLSTSTRVVVAGIVSMSIGLNLLVISSTAIGDARILVDLGKLRESDPARVNPVHTWLNENAPPGSKVLLVGDAQPFDLEIPAVYNTVFDSNRFEELFQNRTAEQRRAALRQEGITHIYFAWSEIERYRSAGNYGYTDYVSRQLVSEELVAEQGLLKPIEPFTESLFRVSD